MFDEIGFYFKENPRRKRWQFWKPKKVIHYGVIPFTPPVHINCRCVVVPLPDSIKRDIDSLEYGCNQISKRPFL